MIAPHTDRWHGRAANGQTYRGVTIGAGFDCEVVRRGPRRAIACMTDVTSRSEWLVWIDVDMETDLQRLAEQMAASPCFDDPDWIAEDSDEWDATAKHWDAAMESRPYWR